MQAKAMLLCFPSKVKAKTPMRALFAPGPVRPDEVRWCRSQAQDSILEVL